MLSDMKAEVLSYIKENGFTSYAELERFFDSAGFDWQGDRAITCSQNNTIFFWQGWNEAAIRIIRDLVKDGLAFIEETTAFVYLLDGKCLNLPLACTSRKYKKTHWLPTVFTTEKRKTAAAAVSL